MIIPDLCLTALNESLIPYLTQPNKGRSQSSCTQTRHLPRTVELTQHFIYFYFAPLS